MPHSLEGFIFVLIHVLVIIMKWPTFCLSSMWAFRKLSSSPTCMFKHTFHFILVIVLAWMWLSRVESKILNVGEELWRETLPLQMGSRLYHLQGLKPDMWYEVKISYPGSVCVFCPSKVEFLKLFWVCLIQGKQQIPASFSLELKRDLTSPVEKQSRKLLDTEKLIFKTEGMKLKGDQVVFSPNYFIEMIVDFNWWNC